jgi:DNA-binding GntR family transcriptional regulator
VIELPRRTSLVAQVADILRRRLETGEWKERLPGEHSICEQLQVSRFTLRQALAILAREGRVRSQAGFGWRICPRPHSNESPAVPKRVGLLFSVPLD